MKEINLKKKKWLNMHYYPSPISFPLILASTVFFNNLFHSKDWMYLYLSPFLPPPLLLTAHLWLSQHSSTNNNHWKWVSLTTPTHPPLLCHDWEQGVCMYVCGGGVGYWLLFHLSLLECPNYYPKVVKWTAIKSSGHSFWNIINHNNDHFISVDSTEQEEKKSLVPITVDW